MTKNMPVDHALVAENLRFYADMRFKQLTLLMGGTTLAGAGVALPPAASGSLALAPRVAVFAAVFTAVMWVMEVRATLYWVAAREVAPEVWPRPERARMKSINATNALLLFHILLYAMWVWLTWHFGICYWLVTALSGIGLLLLVFSCLNYLPLWSYNRKSSERTSADAGGYR